MSALKVVTVFLALTALTMSSAFGPATAQGNCGHPNGDHVVIEVKWEDPIGGLAVRDGPNGGANRLGIIPASGTGIGVGQCQDNGWCQVKYACVSGWSLLARFLAPRLRRLNRVTGVSPDDPEGLNVRVGPHQTYPAKVRIPYNGTDVIKHICQPSPNDRTEWCLVTYRDNSGWVAGRFLTAVATPSPVPSSGPNPGPSPAPKVDPLPDPKVEPNPGPSSGPAPGPSSRACQLFPNLC